MRVPRRALTASAIVLYPFVYDWMNTYERHIHESSPPIADVCHVTRQLLDKIDDIDNHQDNQNHHQVLQVIATQGALFGSTRYPEFLSRYSFPVYRFLFRFSCFRLRRRRLTVSQHYIPLRTCPRSVEAHDPAPDAGRRSRLPFSTSRPAPVAHHARWRNGL